MPGEYPKTDLSFDEVPLEDLRDPVLNGPGVGVIEDSVAAYRTMAEQIERTAERVRSALSTTQAASEGEAADASRRFIESVAAQGDYGAAQAAMAARALGEQAEYHARVRTSMEALKRFRHAPAVPAPMPRTRTSRPPWKRRTSTRTTPTGTSTRRSSPSILRRTPRRTWWIRRPGPPARAGVSSARSGCTVLVCSVPDQGRARCRLG
jgi:hypothetical protein